MTDEPRTGRGQGHVRSCSSSVHTAERWTYNYRATADDDQKTLSCVATVAGLRPLVRSVRLDVDCTCHCHVRLWLLVTAHCDTAGRRVGGGVGGGAVSRDTRRQPA